MNTDINPYFKDTKSIPLTLDYLINTDINFKYHFDVSGFSCSKSPMFKWFVNTQKVLTVGKKDPDWKLIPNKNRNRSFISDDYRYWSTMMRYFIIGYAIDYCKTSELNTTVSLDQLISIFENSDKHRQLINDFTKNMFFDAGIDIKNKQVCRTKSLIQYKTLKICFVSGFQFCADLFLSFNRAKKLGPMGSFTKLHRACEALGFDELPIWYIQESNEHYLNKYINIDVHLQKSQANWAFTQNEYGAFMVANDNPYGINQNREPSKSNAIALPRSDNSFTSAPKSKKQQAKSKRSKNGTASKNITAVEDDTSIAKNNAVLNVEDSNTSNGEVLKETAPRKASQSYDDKEIGTVNDIDSVNKEDVEDEWQSDSDSGHLLNMFNT